MKTEINQEAEEREVFAVKSWQTCVVYHSSFRRLLRWHLCQASPIDGTEEREKTIPLMRCMKEVEQYSTKISREGRSS